MEETEHSPYFSTRVRIADVTSPKDLVGLKEFTIEVTYGNQDTMKISNPEDVGNITEKGIFDHIEEMFKQRDEWAKGRGFSFVDQSGKDMIGLGKASK